MRTVQAAFPRMREVSVQSCPVLTKVMCSMCVYGLRYDGTFVSILPYGGTSCRYCLRAALCVDTALGRHFVSISPGCTVAEQPYWSIDLSLLRFPLDNNLNGCMGVDYQVTNCLTLKVTKCCICEPEDRPAGTWSAPAVLDSEGKSLGTCSTQD